jgi:hypothetical protein
VRDTHYLWHHIASVHRKTALSCDGVYDMIQQVVVLQQLMELTRQMHEGGMV